MIITAASNSDEIISKSAQISRKKGRIILVGVVGLNIDREDFYEKFGFKRDAIRYNYYDGNPKEDALLMSKQGL